MALEEMTEPISTAIPELGGEARLNPHVNICVTADIHVIQIETRPSDDIPDPQGAVFTTLSAVSQEPLIPNNEVSSTKEKEGSKSAPDLAPSLTFRIKDQPVVHKSEEVNSRSVVSQYKEVFDQSVLHESQDIVDQLFLHENQEVVYQPVVQRSQKSTQLNRGAKLERFHINKKAQIKRMVLLPYFGCTTSKILINRPQNKEVTVKSSKSWRKIIEFPKENAKSRLFLSESLDNLNFKNKPPEDKRPEHYESLIRSYKQQLLLKSNSSSLNDSVSNLYFIKDLNTGSQVLFIDEGNIKYLCTPIIDPENNKGTDFLKTNKSTSVTNIAGWEQEIIPACKNIHPKATRNVSILHRPKTRDKTTSTTSLNNFIVERGTDGSVKGLLMSYISAEKDFPSELVLKLVPKKDIENKPIDSKHESAESSETDLLSPILNTPPKRKKKKGKRNIFTMCFKRKKKGDADSSDSNESLTKEIYYPSVVEVYDKKGRKSPSENGSEIEITPTVHNGKERKKK